MAIEVHGDGMSHAELMTTHQRHAETAFGWLENARDTCEQGSGDCGLAEAAIGQAHATLALAAVVADLAKNGINTCATS